MTRISVPPTTFTLCRRGYNRSEVRAHLRELARWLNEGLAPANFMPANAFHRNRFLSGYNAEQVDQFITRLAGDASAASLRVLTELPGFLGRDDASAANSSVLPEFSDAGSRSRWRFSPAEKPARDPWEECGRMSALPGLRLRMTNTLTGSEIIGSSGELLLTRTGRNMTLQDGQVLRLDNQHPPRQQVADSTTGGVVFRIGRCHSYLNAAGYLLLPGQRLWRLPVSGKQLRHAMMTAVTESGTTVLWFRYLGGWLGKYEIAVNPDYGLTAEVLCAIELTADWLNKYFKNPGGGG